jgi:hypothetical protein
MTRSIRSLFLIAALAAPAVALAQVDLGAGDKPAEKKAPLAEVPEKAKPAHQVLTDYLQAVKAKKWANAKKLTHPKTLKAIAERKKKLGEERHPMAPWFYEKTEYYLKDFRITDAKAGPEGTWIFETSEDNYQVQEKGLAENDMATYLLGKTGGKWVVVDKKRGVTFTDDSVKYGYKGWFDKVETPAEEE